MPLWNPAVDPSVPGQIDALPSKVTPIGADELMIEDSADGFNKKKILISALPATVDTTAIHKATAAEISAMTEKVTTANADLLVMEDSAASYAKKKVQLTNLLSGVGSIIRQAQQQDIVVDTTTTTVAPANYDKLMTITLTTGVGYVLLSFYGCSECSSSSGLMYFGLTMDNTDLTPPYTPTGWLARGAVRVSASSNPQPMSFSHVEAVTAGTHTFDLWWGTSTGTGRILVATKPGREEAAFSAIELR